MQNVVCASMGGHHEGHRSGEQIHYRLCHGTPVARIHGTLISAELFHAHLPTRPIHPIPDRRRRVRLSGDVRLPCMGPADELVLTPVTPSAPSPQLMSTPHGNRRADAHRMDNASLSSAASTELVYRPFAGEMSLRLSRCRWEWAGRWPTWRAFHCFEPWDARCAVGRRTAYGNATSSEAQPSGLLRVSGVLWRI